MGLMSPPAFGFAEAADGSHSMPFSHQIDRVSYCAVFDILTAGKPLLYRRDSA